MRLIIPLVLACSTLSIAIPFPNTAPAARFFAKSARSFIDESLGLSASDRQSGLNFSPCASSSDCAGDRICRTPTEAGFVACSVTCLCIRPNFADFLCSSDSDCDEGETCITPPGQSQQVCISKIVAGVVGGNPPEDPPTTGDGTLLTGESCSSDSDCASPRTCALLDSGATLCVPPSFTRCTGNSDCVDGEVCTSLSSGEVCVAASIADPPPGTQAPTTTSAVVTTTAPVTSAPITTDAVTTTTGTTNSDSPPVIPGIGDTTDQGDGEPADEDSTPTSGLTLDPCQNSGECQGSRNCLDLGNGESCSGGDCRCLPSTITPCGDDSSCEEGEGCFTVEEVIDIPFLPDELKQARLCASRSARDNAIAVCIGAHSLSHMSREELVFEKDAVAHVLCDMNDSCATPGHMVRYKGKGMLMKSYCEISGCVRKVMKVNSPKYRRGLTIPSKTEDLMFTALAARFESRAEEGVLSAAVRLGF